MTDGPPGHLTKQKLPILETAGAVYTTAFSLRGHFMKAAAIPLLLSIAIRQGIGSEVDGGLLWIAEDLADLIPYTMFAVACHRLLLLGPDIAVSTLVPRWESRSWRFLIYIAILELILVVSPILSADILFGVFESSDGENGEIWEGDSDLISLLMDAIFWIFVFLFALLIIGPLTYVWVRFSFVLPATAVDRNFGFARSWRETRNYGLRLTALIWLIPSPVIAVFFAMYSVLPDKCQGTSSTIDAIGDAGLGCFAIESFPVAVIETGLYYIIIALTVTLLSIAFRTCTGWVPGVSTLPAESGANG